MSLVLSIVALHTTQITNKQGLVGLVLRITQYKNPLLYPPAGSMSDQKCRVLNNALAALLSEPAPDDSVTPGLMKQYNAVRSAVHSCSKSPWVHHAAKRMVQDKVSNAHRSCTCILGEKLAPQWPLSRVCQQLSPAWWLCMSTFTHLHCSTIYGGLGCNLMQIIAHVATCCNLL